MDTRLLVKAFMPYKVEHNYRKRPIMEQPNSTLLCLPGELRNRIYEYALYAEGGELYFQPGSGYNPIMRTGFRKSYFASLDKQCFGEPWNLLKYVCRQLYAETACLEFSFNTLVFWGVTGNSRDQAWLPAPVFVGFLNELSPTKGSLITKVDLWLTGEVNWDGLEMFPQDFWEFEIIAGFCRLNHKTKVDYLLTDFGAGTEDFWTLIVRGKDLSSKLSVTAASKLDLVEARVWARIFCYHFPGEPNFRVRIGNTWNRKEMNKRFLGAVDTPKFLTADDVERCIDFLDDWTKNGF